LPAYAAEQNPRNYEAEMTKFCTLAVGSVFLAFLMLEFIGGCGDLRYSADGTWSRTACLITGGAMK
jgi:hypothetical protein